MSNLFEHECETSNLLTALREMPQETRTIEEAEVGHNHSNINTNHVTFHLVLHDSNSTHINSEGLTIQK